MKNNDNGMVDLTLQGQPDIDSKKPLFPKPIPLAAWILIIGGLIGIIIRIYLWCVPKN